MTSTPQPLLSNPEEWVNDRGTITVLWFSSKGDLEFELGRIIVQAYTPSSCIIFTNGEEITVKVVLRGADYLRNRGYRLQSGEASPHPPGFYPPN